MDLAHHDWVITGPNHRQNPVSLVIEVPSLGKTNERLGASIITRLPSSGHQPALTSRRRNGVNFRDASYGRNLISFDGRVLPDLNAHIYRKVKKVKVYRTSKAK
jgi:hypothetical protein